MNMIRLTIIVVLVATLLPAPLAHAADKRVAAIHFQRGRALFDAGNWSTALDEFNAGYAAYPLPGFLVNIGQCLRKLERLDEAASAFEKFLDSGSADPRLRAEVQEALAEISNERARQQAAAVAAETEAQHAREDAERHRLQETPPSSSIEPAHPALTLPAAVATANAPAPAPAKKKSRKWVWAIVGVLAAGAVASAVGVTVLETQPQPPRAGSLGTLDGRR
jgi:tetratricopeptide (TPR) repeat protein